MSKNRNKKYNPQKLQTMRNQGKASRSVPLIALTPSQVALKIKAKEIIKQNSFPAIRDQREVCFIKGRLKFGDSKDAAPFPSALVVFGGIRDLSAFGKSF